jgi:hypothetical protein
MPIRNPLMSALGVVFNHYFRFEFKSTDYRSLRYTSSLSTPKLTTKKRYSASAEVLKAVSLNVKVFWDVTLLRSTTSS